MIPISQSVLGNIVREAYLFAYDGKYDPKYEIKSPADGDKKMPAAKFFNQYKSFPNSFIVKQERLPFDPNINAIVLRNGGVIIETARIDLESFVNAADEKNYPFIVRGKSIFFDTELIKTKTQNIGKNSVNRRTILRILPEYNTLELENHALSAIDLIYHKNCFKPDYLPKVYLESNNQNQEMRQNLELKAEMQRIQVPTLLQTLSLSHYMIKSLEVLKMNRKELKKHVENELAINPALEEEK